MPHRITTALCLLLACGSLHAANLVAVSAPSSDSLPEEVSVQGQQQISALQRQIFSAEDEVFGIFNALNSDDLYDIHCVWRARTGSRILQRTCSPNFYVRATTEYARGVIAMMRGESGGNLLPDNTQLAIHYPILEQKMKGLVNESPEFMNAVLRLNELREELEARRGRSVIESD